MRHLRLLIDLVRSSLWFVPALFVLGAVVLAQGLIELDHWIDVEALQADWPRLFGISPSGARAILDTIASSMIGIAGVAFSITIVALTLASSQYSSRILRNFMRDHANQGVLGIFVGIFIYCLLVQRAVRDGDDNFVPATAVLFAVALAFLGIGSLIFFIHHIAMSIQAESIVRSATNETIRTIARLFPTELGSNPEETEALPLEPPELAKWQVIRAPGTGYIQSIDNDGLIAFARERKTVVKLRHGIGVFVAEGSPIAEIIADSEPDTPTIEALHQTFAIGDRRTMVQDASYGIRQIVDVALKALSPGVNDTTTAVTCVEHLGTIIAHLANRRTESPYRMEGDELRAIAPVTDFADLLGEAFDQIRQNAGGNVGVLEALSCALEAVAERTKDPQRRAALRRQLELIVSLCDRSVPEPYDRATIQAVAVRVSEALRED